MRRLRLLFPAIAFAALFLLPRAARCGQVKVDYDHHANFAGYRTYSWGEVDVAKPLSAGHVRQTIDHALQQRGWQELPGSGQLTVSIKDHVRNETQAEHYYSGLGGGWGEGWNWGGWEWGASGGFGEMTKTPASHLVIDIFDTQSKRLLWRGVSQGEIEIDPAKDRQQIDQDLATMLSRLPPKSK